MARDLASESLPPPDDHVTVLRVEFDEPRLTPGLLARDDRRARATERVQNRVLALAAVPKRALDQLDRLHRRVLQVRHGPLDRPDVSLVPIAAPEVVVAFPPAVQDRLVLPLVIRPAKREVVLRPDHEGGPVAARVGERLVQRMQLRRGDRRVAS